VTTALVARRRVDYTCQVTARTTPMLTDSVGEAFVPTKIVAEVFLDNDKARVKVTGHLRRDPHKFRTVTFNLTGYDKNRACPDWLVPIIRYLGYGGHIQGAS
jgi:hypothetical protein